MSAQAQRVATLLGGGQAEREQAYTLLSQVSEKSPCLDAEELAVCAAVVPAFSKVLAGDVSEVGPAEFRRASYLLAKLQLRTQSDGRVSGEYIRLYNGVSLAPKNAMVACLDKPVDELTREDMLTASSVCATYGAAFAKGITNALATIEDPPTEMEAISGYMNIPLTVATEHTRGRLPDQQSLALTRRALALLQAEPDLPNVEASGLWCLVWMCASNRAAIARQILEEALPVAMLALSAGTPSQWLNVSKCENFLYNAVFGAVKDSAELVGGDVVPLLLDCGYLAACVKMLETFEAEGGPTSDSNVMSFFFGVLWNLACLDFSDHGEATALLRSAATPLRYAMENDMIQLRDLGLTTRTFSCMLAANLFGRDEADGVLRLKQDDIDLIVLYLREMVAPVKWGAIFPLPTGSVMLNLSISDAQKLLLLNNPDFIPHAIDGLMIDSEIRTEVTPEARAVAQRNYAELFQQIALFEPGREALLAAECVRPALPAVVEQGQMLLAAGTAATGGTAPAGAAKSVEGAIRCAQNTLSMLFSQNRQRDPSPADGADVQSAHVMLSCESRACGYGQYGQFVLKY